MACKGLAASRVFGGGASNLSVIFVAAIVVLVALVMAISGSRLARQRAIAMGSRLPGMAASF
jgi:hypothetical protein